MIHIKDLRKTYKTPKGVFEAIKKIDLKLEQGEIFGIIGPSGAGKSTLVQCINLLEKPDSGSITLNGQVLTGLSEIELRAQRRRIGMVFQSFNLLSRRTVFNNVALPLEIAGVNKEEIKIRLDELLNLVGLSHLSDRYPAQISGGQKQRVGIARALACHPDVLLSDEATSALDPETTANILDLLRDINRKTGITIVMITHQMEVVKQICDRVAVLSHGAVVEVGATADVFANPRHDVTRAMVSAATESNLSEDSLEILVARLKTWVQAHPGQDAAIWELHLHDAQVSGGLFSGAAKHEGVSFSLLQAKVEDIKGVAVGKLYVQVQGSAQAILNARQALSNEAGVQIQEVVYESAND